MVGKGDAAGYRADQAAKKDAALPWQQPIRQGPEITPRLALIRKARGKKSRRLLGYAPTMRRRMRQSLGLNRCAQKSGLFATGMP
jgi:hypothetical protein